MHEEDKSILKSLVSVAWADGRISHEETEVLEALFQAFEVTEEEEAEIREYAKTPRTLADIPLTELSADDRIPDDEAGSLLLAAEGRAKRFLDLL